MFSSFFDKDKPRVFLGNLSVVPRSEFTEYTENGWFIKDGMDFKLKESLEGIFSLTPVEKNNEPIKTDLVLDVIVSKFQMGAGGYWHLMFTTIPFLWRPKIKVKARLYSYKTKKTKRIYSASESIKGMRFFNGIFSFQNFIGLRSAFSEEDIDELLHFACQKLLNEINGDL